MDRSTGCVCCVTSAGFSLPQVTVYKYGGRRSLTVLHAGSSKLRLILCRRCKLDDCANSGLTL